VPLAAQLSGRPNDDFKLDFLLRSAHVYAHQSTSSGEGTFSGITDTTFSTTATYYGWNGSQPFVSLNINIPTGTSNASGNAQRAKSDSDIVQLPAFGEGWNFGPTIGATIPINQTTSASLGIGYTYRGPFDREGVTAPTRLDPGDVTTANAALGYRGERLSLKGSVAYSWETVTTLDGGDFYQAGDRMILTGAAGYAWTNAWSSRVQVTYTHQNKNKVLMPGASALTLETFNSNSDIYNVTLDTTYAGDNFSIGPTGGYVYRTHNAYDPTTFQFLPAKTSWSAGMAATYAPTKTSQLKASVQRIWVTEGSSPDKFASDGTFIPNSAVPVSLTDAWQISVGGVIRF
jgi:hypothetical protein